MMGYNEEDIYKMMASISIAKAYLPLNTSNEEVLTGLQNTYDFLDGLIVEGRL